MTQPTIEELKKDAVCLDTYSECLQNPIEGHGCNQGEGAAYYSPKQDIIFFTSLKVEIWVPDAEEQAEMREGYAKQIAEIRAGY